MEHITLPQIQMIILAAGIIVVIILLLGIKRTPKTPQEVLDLVGFITNITPAENSFISYRGSLIEDEFKKALDKLEVNEEFKERLISGVVGYLKAPVIEDDIEDDNIRDKKEQSFYKTRRDVYDFYRSNRLRRNNIMNVLLLSGLLDTLDVLHNESLKKTESEAWKEVSTVNSEGHILKNLEKYESLTKIQKLAAVKKVAHLSREICIKMIEESKKVQS